MALESDKTTEARRKALRNGEEDPVVVAQRFLNIYRQKHILSPERQEAFNKLLLDLSPEIRGIFSSLPGGALLQDYADELAEQRGVQKSVHAEAAAEMSTEAHQQAQILATALAKAQIQSPVGAATQVVAAPSKLSMDKDFAGEFAKIIGNLMQEQANIHKESMEKLSSDLNKAQMNVAESIKEGKDEYRQEIKDICKALVEGAKNGMSDQRKDFEYWYQMMNENFRSDREDRRREINEISRIIIDGYRASRDAQREDTKELCKIIAQSQTDLGAMLSSSVEKEMVSASQTDISEEAKSTTKLIEAVLDGQKQLTSRLKQVEELSLKRANDNKHLVEAFTKSQTELLNKINVCGPINAAATEGLAEMTEQKLQQLIDDSQSKLVNKILAANLQQNQNLQTNNNANNIQINTADLSLPIAMLVDKISSLQASNEQNLEKAIVKLLEEQGKLYDKISRQQSQDLANILRPVIANGGSSILPREDIHQTEPLSEEQKTSADETSYREEQEQNTYMAEAPTEEMLPRDDIDEQSLAVFNDTVSEDESIEKEHELTEGNNAERPKKKKKKRKKKKNIPSDGIIPSTSTKPEQLPELSAVDDLDLPASDITLEDIEPNILPISDSANIEAEEVLLPTTEDTIETFDEHTPISNAYSIPSSEDWGFGSTSTSGAAAIINNDNEEGQDWEWAYVEDGEYTQLEAIGDNSYICSGNLSYQEKISAGQPLSGFSVGSDVLRSPQVFEEGMEEDFVDPYQNSILKD